MARSINGHLFGEAKMILKAERMALHQTKALNGLEDSSIEESNFFCYWFYKELLLYWPYLVYITVHFTV